MVYSMNKLDELKAKGEAPSWYSDHAFQMVSESYLYRDETPRQMYKRIAKSVASYLPKHDLEDKFFDLMWRNWLCPSTPVCVNSGLDIGLPISCFSSYVPDSTDKIMDTIKEVAMLSKYGGGTAIHMNDVRPKGAPISKGGFSDGIVPFMKMFDSTILGIAQGSNRRGSCAVYIDIEHKDYYDFLRSRYPAGDANRQCLNLHHAVTISNTFIEKLKNGDQEARKRYKELLKTRLETGEPYVTFIDVVNSNTSDVIKSSGITIKGGNLCNEIWQGTDEFHTLVCCLASMNLARWDEWKETDAVEVSIMFLDGVMSEFIEKAQGIPGFERALNSAIKGRALGLGVLGFHSYLQKNMISIESLEAYLANRIMFKNIQAKAKIGTRALAEAYGEPEWCKGFGVRNSLLMAIAPTSSNSIISSSVSRGIEPWIANIFAEKSAKGTFVVKNPALEQLFISMNRNTDEVWASINKTDGSVQHLDFLSDEQKEVFLTAREINQFTLIKLAEARQDFIDQGQSLNLFFPANSDPKYIHEVHMAAMTSGKIKGLYYLRSTSVLKADVSVNATYKREVTECKMCEG